MSPVFAARRRAEEFDALVEARAAGRPVEDARFDDLLDVSPSLAKGIIRVLSGRLRRTTSQSGD